MARPRRLRIVDYPFHVIVRGTNQQPIFRGEGDRMFFHRTLTRAAGDNGVAVHAYVFMTNHVHLLASGTAFDSVSKAIQALGRRYVRYFNFVHERVGTLWQGRFHSSVVDTDRYFLVCQRYIELNPVRAGICRHPADFPWSSHRHYARGIGDDLVTRHRLHSAFGPDEYCRIFEQELTVEQIAIIRDAIRHGLPLGDDAFRDTLARLTGQRTKPRARGRPGRSEREGHAQLF